MNTATLPDVSKSSSADGALETLVQQVEQALSLTLPREYRRALRQAIHVQNVLGGTMIGHPDTTIVDSCWPLITDASVIIANTQWLHENFDDVPKDAIAIFEFNDNTVCFIRTSHPQVVYYRGFQHRRRWNGTRSEPYLILDTFTQYNQALSAELQTTLRAL